MHRTKWWFAAAILLAGCVAAHLSQTVRNPILAIQVDPGFTGPRWRMELDGDGNRQMTIGPPTAEITRLLPKLPPDVVARLVEAAGRADVWSLSHFTSVTDQPTFVLRSGQREVRIYDPRDWKPGPERTRFVTVWNEVLQYVPPVDRVAPAEYRMTPR